MKQAEVFCHKDSTGELCDPRYFICQGESRPVQKGELNGLESTQDRRSAGRHGNQHVCVRRPQVSGGDLSRFDAGGSPGVTRPRTWGCGRNRESTSKRF